MQLSNLDTIQIKTQLINCYHALIVFINNNKQYIKPENLAELFQLLDKLESKMRTAFQQDELLDSIIEDFENETKKQDDLITFLTKKLSKSSTGDDPEDEYKGVRMNV